MKRYDYVIVGSGLFAATFAYEAKKAGKKMSGLGKEITYRGKCILRGD